MKRPRTISRRGFLQQTSGAIAIGFAGLHTLFANPASGKGSGGFIVDRYGDLIPDPDGILDLPQEFAYRVFSRMGDLMDDGLLVPGNHDGMAAFPGPDGKTILVRNHELSANEIYESPFGTGNELVSQVPREKMYDPGLPDIGGTTTLIYDTRTGTLENHYLSLAGTMRNCAGGPTPWNSWVTCEETVQRAVDGHEKDHGYNFDVPADATGLVNPVPLIDMGRLYHEAIAVDPKNWIVYQTEDRSDGLIYRFIPNQPGNLAAGGRLQALAIRDMPSVDTRNWVNQIIHVGQIVNVTWIDINNVESPEDDLRHQGFSNGAAMFARGEGMWYGNGAIYFACTNGGAIRTGQIWRYFPSQFEGTTAEDIHPGQLDLFIEPNNSNLLENADNVTIAPWGDLILCEDGIGVQFLVGVTPEGNLYKFGKNSLNDSEFAGVTFSPDGTTLFVNVQNPGLTLAITGPFQPVPTSGEPSQKLVATFGQIRRAELFQNYPNPFNPETWIPFNLAEATHIRMDIFSSSGSLVRRLDLGYLPAGDYRHQSKAAYWDGRDSYGERVSTGIYFLQMHAGDYTGRKKLVVRQ